MKVLITRRTKVARKSADRFAAIGFDPILFPLFAIEPVESAKPQLDPDFLIFTSAAGVEVIANSPSPFTKSLPVYSVGGETSHKLREQGYTNIRQGAGTALELAALIKSDFNAEMAHGIHISGEQISFDFVSDFQSANITCQRWIVYRTISASPPKEDLEAALSDAKGGIAVLYSPQSAKTLFDLVQGFGLNDYLKDITFVAISRKTALAVDKVLAKGVLISDEPNEDSMLDRARQELLRLR